jgi:hypothetical protein
MRKQYEAALAELEGATEREYPSGIVVTCRDHTFSLRPEIYAALGHQQ